MVNSSVTITADHIELINPFIKFSAEANAAFESIMWYTRPV